MFSELSERRSTKGATLKPNHAGNEACLVLRGLILK
jgi:hypothetical protein